MKTNPDITTQDSYPVVTYEQLSWRVPPEALDVWETLGAFKYTDTKSECRDECYLRPWQPYLDKGYYLGQRNSLTQLREGRGVWISNHFEQMYEGYWAEDKFQGEGRLIQFNGTSFEGTFSQGKKQGTGYYRDKK